jgi:hypothetical protein
MQVVRYTPEWEEGWNACVRDSKNGTFLINRNYMEYHKDRFTDCSLIFAEGDKIIGVMPSNWDESTKTVYSHEGLTYGGIILAEETTAHQVLQMVDEMIQFYRDYMNADKIIYKPTPYIYHRYPSQEDLYAIFSHGAKIIKRDLACVIPLKHPLNMRRLRTRWLNKALQNQLYLSKSADVNEFWTMMDNVLMEYHGKHPVHSRDELQSLMNTFPKEIQLFIVKNVEEKVIAGVVLYLSPQVVHIQYGFTDDEGRKMGALDLVYHYIMTEKFKDIPYLDFGTSMDNGGYKLNDGLVFQKEGFGGRGVCYDTYEINIDKK